MQKVQRWTAIVAAFMAAAFLSVTLTNAESFYGTGRGGGGGSGTISSGTTDYLPKYTGATTLGDSTLSDDGGGEFTWHWGGGNIVRWSAANLAKPEYYYYPAMGNYSLFNTIGVLAPSVSWNGGNRLAGVAVSAPTFSSGAVATNVATINTTAAHGLTTGDTVTISGSAGVSVNGTYQVTVVDSDTFTFNKTVGDGTITAATIAHNPNVKLGGFLTTASPLGDVVIGTTATTQKALVLQAKASQTANLQEWQQSTGSVGASSPGGYIQAGGNYIFQFGNSTADFCGIGSSGSIFWESNSLGRKAVVTGAAGADTAVFRTASDGQYGFNSTSNLNGGGIDSGMGRSAASVTKSTNGTTSLGWHQTAGDLLVNADQAVDSATLTNATTLVTVSIATTRKIAFEAYLPFTAGDTVADGIQLDFAQGTATATYFIADAELVDGAGFATLTNPRVSALNTAISVAATTNTNFTVKIRGALVVNGAGTFGLRFAKVADAGTGLTLKRGAWMKLWDMP